MARLVLLIEPDVDELGVIASKLRVNGLEVAIADSLEHGIEQARGRQVSVLLVSAGLVNTPGFEERLALEPALAHLPRFTLVDGVGARQDAELARRRLPRAVTFAVT